MTARQAYNQRIRPFALAVWIVMAAYFAALIAVRVAAGPDTLLFVVLFAGFLPIVVASLFYHFNARCPKCGGRIANLFGSTQASGWPYPGKLPKTIIACPFCGLRFDAELEEEAKENGQQEN
ncbi:hypothetical protein ACFLQR_00390 [Verrucomicrobiota bacterium]